MDHPAAFQNFYAAILADNDEQTEQKVADLTTVDEMAILALLSTTDANQRWWAVRALAHCGTAVSAPGLIERLADRDVTLRAAAALALGHLVQREPALAQPVLTPLAARLADDEAVVRQAAADALVLCGDSAVPMLAQVLQDHHEGARTRAAYALRKIATMQAAGVLYRCLNDPNYLVHTYAYEGLDEMGLLENILVTL